MFPQIEEIIPFIRLKVVPQTIGKPIGHPQNGWFIIENPIQMDDLRIPLFHETFKSPRLWPNLQFQMEILLLKLRLYIIINP